MDECAVQEPKEFDGENSNSATKEGFDLGDEDEKNKIQELKAEFEPLTKLMNEVLGDKVGKMIVSDRIVDSPLCSRDVRAQLVCQHGANHESTGAARQLDDFFAWSPRRPWRSIQRTPS